MSFPHELKLRMALTQMLDAIDTATAPAMQAAYDFGRRTLGETSAAPVNEKREVKAWLVEAGEGMSKRPCYFDGDEWTFDADEALRFSREQDAQRVIDNIGWTEAKPVEHMWVLVPAAPDGETMQ